MKLILATSRFSSATPEGLDVDKYKSYDKTNIPDTHSNINNNCHI